MIVLANKLPQLVTVSVLKDGALAEVKLAPNASSEPIADNCLTDHARQLIAAGHIKVRRA